MIKNIVCAIYALRMKTSDNYKDAVANAIFFAALFMMLGIIVIMVFISRMLGLDIDLRPIDDWLGIGAGKVFAFFLFICIWIFLKFRFKNIKHLELEEVINKSTWLRNKPELVAFSPLIVVFVLLVVILLF